MSTQLLKPNIQKFKKMKKFLKQVYTKNISHNTKEDDSEN